MLKRFALIILSAIFIVEALSCIGKHDEVEITEHSSPTPVESDPHSAEIDNLDDHGIITFVPLDTGLPSVTDETAAPTTEATYSSKEPVSSTPNADVTETPSTTDDATTPPVQNSSQATLQPTVTPTTAATIVPTDAPQTSDMPASDEIQFAESSSLPLPSMKENLPKGQPFCFGGVVKANSPILTVKAVISSESGYYSESVVRFDASENKTKVELVDPTFPREGDNSLTKKTKFENLSAGTYSFCLYASAVGVAERLIKSSSFKVVSDEWHTLISNHLRNNYAFALSFFGDRDEFLFKYKWEDGRQIKVEQSWLNAHIGNVTSPSGKKWYVHKKAVPSYEQAIAYMNSTYLRVRGSSDSGIIKLWDLVKTFDGTLNTRFVSERTFVSHHAFGTAIDINASMDANLNRLENRALIMDEVSNHLTYNGIKTSNGISYYDFTYDGSHSSKHKNIPTTIINYLLYELAFYRAGFGWGYYYTHACDGMHFTVSELPTDLHNTSSRALRKVYSYIMP